MQLDQIKRREFITLLGGAAAWPLAAGAQQPAPVVGVLAAPAPEPLRDQITAFRQGMNQSGYIEGANVTVEYRWAEGHYDRLPAMANELIARGAAVIVALAPAAAAAAKTATATIPIVFVIGADPVELGLVRSLNQPGGNITGVNFLINALGGKRLQLIRELVPTAKAIGLLVNPSAPGTDLDRQEAEKVAATIGQKIVALSASSERDFEEVFTTIARGRIGALIVSPDALFTSRREQLVALAARYAVPTIYHLREAAAAGGLMSYGTSITDAHRLAGTYTGRILKGERPDRLPVQQSTRFELVINLKTAKALSINVPEKLLSLADEVIE
jgi:putative tryptophan/tyrosine transport system substrate-binding protein